jgi:hypothetical protein
MSRKMSILVTLALAACACRGEVGYRGTVAVSTQTPDLVYAAPGVSVIADYDEPIFFANGYYWWNYGGYWYRSSHYTGGWVYAQPPIAIARIHDPYSYRRYRPSGWVARHRPVPSHRIERPRYRDYRSRR